MSFIFHPRSNDAYSIVRGRVEVCLRRILRDLVGAGLDGSVSIRSLFVSVRVFTGLILLIYDFLHRRRLLL